MRQRHRLAATALVASLLLGSSAPQPAGAAATRVPGENHRREEPHEALERHACAEAQLFGGDSGGDEENDNDEERQSWD